MLKTTCNCGATLYKEPAHAGWCRTPGVVSIRPALASSETFRTVRKSVKVQAMVRSDIRDSILDCFLIGREIVAGAFERDFEDAFGSRYRTLGKSRPVYLKASPSSPWSVL